MDIKQLVEFKIIVRNDYEDHISEIKQLLQTQHMDNYLGYILATSLLELKERMSEMIEPGNILHLCRAVHGSVMDQVI